jgi:hypothetical protein
MGQMGRRVVEERFSAHAMVRRMEELYLDLLGRRGTAGERAVQRAA